MAIQFIDPKKAKPGTRMVSLTGAEPKTIIAGAGRGSGKGEPIAKTFAQRVIKNLEEQIEAVKPSKQKKGGPISKDAKIAKGDSGPEKFTPERSSGDGRRGPLKTGGAKQQITLRLDPDIIEKFKALGSGWQSKLNDALRSHLRLGDRK